MKVLLDIEEGKKAFVMELLNNLSFVKAKPITNEKAELMSDIHEAVNELKEVKEGKLKSIPAKELLDEL